MKNSLRLLVCASIVCAAPSALAQLTVRVSINSSGVEGNDGSFAPALSADGRWVAFTSLASDLVPGDTNGTADIFVHDRKGGGIERVSVSASGAEADADCLGAYLSADGRYVSFRTPATTLVAGDTNGASDVFVHDRETGVTARVSVDAGGNEGDDESYYGSLSADGRFVCFISDASNLVPGDTNDDYDVFVHDRATGAVEIASVGPTGAPGNYYSVDSQISADGRYVVFASWAMNLLPVSDDNSATDVFLRDRVSRTTSLVSSDSAGIAASGFYSAVPSISDDGRFVAFTSDASNLVPSDTNGAADVFVKDVHTGATERVSVSSSGAQSNGTSTTYYSHAAISGDGRFVVFESMASNLVLDDTNGVTDIFVHDRESHTTVRASVRTDGIEGTRYSYRGTISADGRSVAFETRSSNLVPGDTNNVFDVFVHDLRADCPQVAAYCVAKTNSLGCTPVIGASGYASLTANDGVFVTAVDVLSRTGGAFFWGTAPDAKPFGGGTLCVAEPRVFTRIRRSGGNSPIDCSGVYSFHFSRAYMTALGLMPGTTIYGQYLTRDPGFAPPDNIGLSNAIRFTVCP